MLSVAMIPLGLFLLLASGLLISCSLGFLGAIIIFFYQGGTTALGALGSIAFSTTNSFTLTAVPLFILMAEVLSATGVAGDIFETARLWIGKLPGGLAVAAEIACAIFGAMCGSSVAGAAAIGRISIEEMLKRNYDVRLTTGAVAAGGSLSILIPPSISMIIYGAVTDQSIAKLFIAGAIPGIFLTLHYIIYIIIRVIANPSLAPIGEGASWPARLRGVIKLWPALILVAVVFYVIYLGVCTPTEAAAIGSFLACLIGLGKSKGKFLRMLISAATSTALLTGMIFMIIVGAMIFGYALTLMGSTQQITAWTASLPVSRWVVMLLINILLGILGCLMDSTSIMLITLPILYPIIVHLGFDPIWFAVVMVVNMEMSVLTPPVGLNLFVIHGLTGKPMSDIIRGSMPFVGIDAWFILVLCLFPQMALWLPGMMK